MRKLVSLVLHELSSCHSSQYTLELSLLEVEWTELRAACITAECSLFSFVLFLTSSSDFLLLGGELFACNNLKIFLPSSNA